MQYRVDNGSFWPSLEKRGGYMGLYKGRAQEETLHLVRTFFSPGNSLLCLWEGACLLLEQKIEGGEFYQKRELEWREFPKKISLQKFLDGQEYLVLSPLEGLWHLRRLILEMEGWRSRRERGSSPLLGNEKENIFILQDGSGQQWELVATYYVPQWGIDVVRYEQHFYRDRGSRLYLPKHTL
jgi:hypothetical protein